MDNTDLKADEEIWIFAKKAYPIPYKNNDNHPANAVCIGKRKAFQKGYKAAQSSPIEDKRAKSLEILKRYIKETPPEEVAALVEKYSKSDIGTAAIEETKKWSNEDMKAAWQAGVNSMIDSVDIEEVQYFCFEDFIQSPKGEDKTQTVKETAEQFFDRFFHTSTPNRNFIIRKMEEYANQFK